MFNQIYRLTTDLAFLPDNQIVNVYTLVDQHEEEMSDEALEWCGRTYIGPRNERRGDRSLPRIKLQRLENLRKEECSAIAKWRGKT